MINLRDYSLGLPAALVATALWGFTFLGPAAIKPINIYYLVLGRYVIFGLISLIVLAVNIPTLRRHGALRTLKAMHLGVVGYIGFYLLLSMSAATGGGVLASTLTGLIPAMVAVASNVIERAIGWWRLSWPLAMTCYGLFLLNAGFTAIPVEGGQRGILMGTALGFLASVAWSYFVIVNGTILKRAKGTIDNTVWTASIGFGAFCASLLLAPLAQSAGGVSPFSNMDMFWHFLIWCAALAVLGSWCATWFWNIGTRRLPTTMVGPIIAMEAVFGAAFNLIWDGRLPTFYEFGGGLLVVFGVFLCAYSFNKARIAATAPAPSHGGRGP